MQKDTTVGDFVKSVQDEDNLVSSISFTKAKGAVTDAENLYTLLSEQQASQVMINNIVYSFEGALTNGLDTSFKPDDYYQKCLQMGLSPMNASTVSQMHANLAKSLEDGKEYTPEEIHSLFRQSAAIFECSVLREKIFEKFTVRLNLQAELDAMEQRYAEIC